MPLNHHLCLPTAVNRLNMRVPGNVGPRRRSSLPWSFGPPPAATETLNRRFSLDELRLGLFVRVGCGLHERTRQLPTATMLFTVLVRQHFPGSPFLTLALLRDPCFGLHRDAQNDWLPNLVVELRQYQAVVRGWKIPRDNAHLNWSPVPFSGGYLFRVPIS